MEWHSFGTPFVIAAFEREGYAVERMPFPREEIDARSDAACTERLVHRLMGGEYACAFTFNYFPVVAMACKACRIPYVSWTYDSPFALLYSKTLAFDTNLAFVFDSHTVEHLRGMGYGNVHYLPMAAPPDGYAHLPQRRHDRERYQAEVAFVGSLYSEDFHNPFRRMEELEGYHRGMIDGLVQAQMRVYGYHFLQEVLEERPDLVRAIDALCPYRNHGDSLESVEWVYANYYLSRQVTALERQSLLARMAERFRTCIYTPEKSGMPPALSARAQARGKVDYYTEAPYVYRHSKVNLNITLRSIHTGIPLRVFDILGNGGFLLSNWQADLEGCFAPDADLVCYESMEDAVEKAAFYLEHEDLRKKIASCGRERVLREHTYPHRVRQMCAHIEEYWSRI